MVDLTPAAASKLQGILVERGLAGYGLRVLRLRQRLRRHAVWHGLRR